MKLPPHDHVTGTILGAIIGSFIGVAGNVIGWGNVMAVALVLAIAVAAVRTLRCANDKHHQINQDELNDPDPFNTRLRVYPDTDTTGETR